MRWGNAERALKDADVRPSLNARAENMNRKIIKEYRCSDSVRNEEAVGSCRSAFRLHSGEA